MAGPWEKYQTQESAPAGPWQKYAATASDPYNGSFANDGTTGPTFARGGTALPEEKTLGGAGMTWMENAISGIPIVGPSIQKGSDYIGSNLYGLATGQDPAQIREEVNKRREGRNEVYPLSAISGKIGGAIAGTAPMVAAAPASFGAGAGSFGARTGMGALSGGMIGGTDAAARSNYDPLETVKGAGFGLAFGAAGPVVGGAISSGINKARGWFGGPSTAQKNLIRAASADGVNDIAGRLSQMGPDAMPMDIGPNLQAQAAALAGTPGGGQQTIRNAISQRQAGAGGRIAGALDDALGQNVDTIAIADDIIARRSAAAKPLYEAAYSKPVPFTKELEDLLTRPTVGKALKKAQTLAADEGMVSKQWFANVADDGKVTIQNVPDVRQLDLTKRALDDMISAAQRAGNNNEARIFIQQKDLLMKMVDGAVPEYAQARKAFSDPTAVLDAMEQGKRIFSNQMTPNQMISTYQKMGQAEREAFIQGGRAAIADTMGTARNDALAARSLFDKGYNREKLNLLVGKEKGGGLLNALDSEKAFTSSRDRVVGNSETFARAQAANDIGANAKQPGVVRELLNMKAGSAAAKFADRFTGGVKNSLQDSNNVELANLLTVKAGDRASLDRAINAVQNAQRNGSLTARDTMKIVVGLQQDFARKPAEVIGPDL